MNKNKWFALPNGCPPLYESLIAAGFFLLCFAILLPELFFLIRSPMGGDGATLKDPAVSFAVFMPAFREFRSELLEHGNILWSNLRGMGLPILGNGVQGAPLFPLNLALLWLPDHIYWSVMPIARIVLIALGAYLLARRVFGLSMVAGVVFAILIGFNVNIVRWINHPWLNGVLAGVWYLYFSCTVFALATARRSQVGLHCLGLVVGVFAMITCGFPEASAVAAIFAAFSFIGFTLAGWRVFRKDFGKRLALLTLCHLIGFCLSAVQVFALVEFVDLGAIEDLREGYIKANFRPDQALPFGLAQFTHFWMSGLQQSYLNFYVGLF
ncbi:MAG: hypothetical protein HKN85_00980, partial [Gammaproteobacteria bacterium]|nr:hypothetical protein [Gammaproteobacteria bacterium]